MQSIFSIALIRGGSKTHRLVGHKARDAVVAGALDHAARNDMPVAAGGVCGERGADLSLFSGLDAGSPGVSRILPSISRRIADASCRTWRLPHWPKRAASSRFPHYERAAQRPASP